MSELSRRTILLAGAGALLAACGGSSGNAIGGEGATTVPAVEDVPADQLQLIRFFMSGTAPADVRHVLPFGLGSSDGIILTGGPERLDVRVLDANGEREVMAPSVAVRHAKQLDRPYWPVEVELPLGRYQAVFSLDGQQIGSNAFFDVGGFPNLPKTGDKVPVTKTPTTSDAQGVEPICTRQPACPLHEVSLDAALSQGRPIALMIATPAYCKTAVCGPTLDILLNNRVEGITYIHAEVWKDDTFAEAAPALQAFGLQFEPVLYVIRADGTIADRLDVIFDADAVSEALAKAT